MSNIVRTYTKRDVNVRLSFTTKFVVFVLQIMFLAPFIIIPNSRKIPSKKIKRAIYEEN